MESRLDLLLPRNQRWRPGVVSALLEQRNLKGFTPLFEAVVSRQWKIMEMLVDRGASVDVPQGLLNETSVFETALTLSPQGTASDLSGTANTDLDEVSPYDVFCLLMSHSASPEDQIRSLRTRHLQTLWRKTRREINTFNGRYLYDESRISMWLISLVTILVPLLMWFNGNDSKSPISTVVAYVVMLPFFTDHHIGWTFVVVFVLSMCAGIFSVVISFGGRLFVLNPHLLEIVLNLFCFGILYFPVVVFLQGSFLRVVSLGALHLVGVFLQWTLVSWFPCASYRALYLMLTAKTSVYMVLQEEISKLVLILLSVVYLHRVKCIQSTPATQSLMKPQSDLASSNDLDASREEPLASLTQAEVLPTHHTGMELLLAERNEPEVRIAAMLIAPMGLAAAEVFLYAGIENNTQSNGFSWDTAWSQLVLRTLIGCPMHLAQAHIIARAVVASMSSQSVSGTLKLIAYGPVLRSLLLATLIHVAYNSSVEVILSSNYALVCLAPLVLWSCEMRGACGWSLNQAVTVAFVTTAIAMAFLSKRLQKIDDGTEDENTRMAMPGVMFLYAVPIWNVYGPKLLSSPLAGYIVAKFFRYWSGSHGNEKKTDETLMTYTESNSSRIAPSLRGTVQYV